MYRKIIISSIIALFATIGTVFSQSSKIAEVDSTTMAYYQECLKATADPVVIQMADTLYQMAGSVGDQRMQAVALCTKLDYYYYNSDIESQQDSIIKWTRHIQHFAKQTNQPKYYYFVWAFRLINHYLYRKEYNTALFETQNLLKEAEAEDYKEAIADYYSIMANIYAAKDLYPRYIEFTIKEIEFFEEYDLDRYNISFKYGVVGEYLSKEGKFDEAEKYFAKGEKLANTYSQELYIKLNRVYYYTEKGELEAAGKMLSEVQEIFDTIPSLKRKDDKLQKTEIIYYSAIKEYDKVLKSFDEWEETIELHQMDASKSKLYKMKGDLYQKMGRAKDAAEAYRKYIEITQKEKLEDEEIAATEMDALIKLQKLNEEKEGIEKLIKERQLQYNAIIILLLSTILSITIYFLYRQRKLNRKLKRSRDTLNEKNIILLKAEEELRHAKEIAERNNEMKDIFIQNISHEIRTPLNSIVGFTTIMSELCPTEEVKSFGHTIEENSRLLLKIINDIIEISDLDRGANKVNYSSVSLNECGVLAIEEIRPILSDGVELSFALLPDNPFVTTDNHLVMQVLGHLLNNAAKFTSSGSINLAIELDDQKKETRFIVTDTGIGIPKDEQEHIFERFVKLDEFSQGTGLGLSICYLSAQKLNGYLIIDKEYTSGSRFIFGIPV